jgi:hypothetical protein
MMSSIRPYTVVQYSTYRMGAVRISDNPYYTDTYRDGPYGAVLYGRILLSTLIDFATCNRRAVHPDHRALLIRNMGITWSLFFPPNSKLTEATCQARMEKSSLSLEEPQA